MVNIKGINQNSRRKWTYPDLESAIRPIPHSDKVSVQAFDHLPELTESSNESSSYVDAVKSCSNKREFEGALATPLQFNQVELNGLIGDLNLSKDTSEDLASQLNEKNLLQPDTNVMFYQKREKDFLPYFFRENYLIF